MRVTLEFRYASLGKAYSTAVCQYRLTRTLIVVESGKVMRGTNTLGGVPYKFKRRSGLPVPHIGSRDSGWRLARGEAIRIESEVNGEGDQPSGKGD